MSDPKEDGNQEELEWLLFELDEAREDQRVSLDHIVQVLVACIAALAICILLRPDLALLKIRFPGRMRESLRLQPV